MNNDIKISIITVSYNASATIESTIQSICNQTYNNLEYLIIDGDSKDDTVQIIKKYSDKIAYFVSEPDGGIYDAMNKGVRQATGEFVYFLGADDCLVDELIIERIVRMLNNTTDILCAGVYLVDEEMLLQRYMGSLFAQDRDKYNGLMIPHQGMFVRRHLMLENPFSLDYNIASDYDFFLKCYLSNDVKFQFLDIPVAYYSSGGVSTHSFFSNDEYIDIMNKHHLPQATIDYVCKKFNTPFKQFFKNILRKIGIMKWLFLLKGAQKHQCSWEHCRWCRR